MSAEKKNRKRQQRTTGQKYQHPTREGVPYGRSPHPRPAWAGEDPDVVIRDIIRARDAWKSSTGMDR